MQRVCPYSGETFVVRRKNQVFASAEYRKLFHKMQAKKTRSVREKIFSQIQTNLKILCDQVQEGERRTISLQLLNQRGYAHNACTHVENFEGNSCIGIAEFVVVNIEVDKDIIIIYRKMQQELDQDNKV